MSDFRYFAGWTEMDGSKGEIRNDINFINAKVISEYKNYLVKNNFPNKTINRRLSTVRRFCSFCISQGWMKENPAKQIFNIKNLPAGRQGQKSNTDILDQFRDDLKQENLDQSVITNYLADISEFLSI